MIYSSSENDFFDTSYCFYGFQLQRLWIMNHWDWKQICGKDIFYANYM